MPAGQAFITHEFDEAIAIQETICQCGEALSASHPVAAVKRQLARDLKIDQRHLELLQKFGKPFDATGKREQVAAALTELAEETSRTAGEEQSEAYEAHAVLLTLKRKQQDSADAMVKIARDQDDAELRDAATKLRKEIKASADALAKSLAAFAVRIASA